MTEQSKIREPKQERSIETKNKIIKAGYEVFSSVGYYGTNTAEIARQAGVSTGIVYGYFKDKRDILLCVLKIYIDEIKKPVIAIMDGLDRPVDLNWLSIKLLDEVIRLHEKNARLHNTLHSLAATDDGINSQFIELEGDLTTSISEKLTALGVDGRLIREKVHLAMNVVQSYAHEYVFDNHAYLDYEKMKDLVCSMMVELFA